MKTGCEIQIADIHSDITPLSYEKWAAEEKLYACCISGEWFFAVKNNERVSHCDGRFSWVNWETVLWVHNKANHVIKAAQAQALEKKGKLIKVLPEMLAAVYREGAAL